MNTKMLLAIILLFIGGLVVFNVMNGSSNPSITDETTTAEVAAGNTDSEEKITDKPLGEQPKAMLDKAQSQIDEANKLESEKMEQVDGLQ